MPPALKQLTSGLLGGTAFLGFLLGLHQTPLIAGFFSLATFAGLLFLLPSKPALDYIVPGVVRADWHETLAQGKQVSQTVRALVARNPKSALSPTFIEIAEVIEGITARLKDDPECHKLVGLFLKNEAKEVLPVLNLYMELVSKSRMSASLEKQLSRSEKIIPLIKDKMDEHYQKLLGNELLEFEVASETLAAILGVDEFDLQQLEDSK